MPTICKKDACRNKAVYGYVGGKPLFCSAHREDGSKNTRMLEHSVTTHVTPVCVKCCSTSLMPRFKGFCKRCYIETYPTDPLSLQCVYKSKEDVIQKFIDSKFDGFIHKEGTSEIQICGGVVLQIVYGTTTSKKTDGENIVITFHCNKYADGKNPMLYTRLPNLEKEIARQFERIMAGMEKENSEL